MGSQKRRLSTAEQDAAAIRAASGTEERAGRAGLGGGLRQRSRVALLFLVCAACGGQQDVERPPNIVLIVADDLGVETLGCYGGTSYATPQLDQLAADGIRFDACFSTPICTPSRVQLLTGRYPFRTGWTRLIGAEGNLFDASEERTFAQVLREAGYVTGVTGKWQLAYLGEHPDHPDRCGFDEWRLWQWRMREGAAPANRYWSPGIVENGRRLKTSDTDYGPDLFADFAVDFIERHRDEAFLLYYPMVLPHPPFVPPPTRGGRPREQALARNNPRQYRAMVEHMDGLVGRIVEALERLELTEHTLIIFTGDNGSPREVSSVVRGGKLAGGKGLLNDAGTHVPLLARWDGQVPPGVSESLVDLSDFLPTLVEVAGTELPELEIDGVSFLPELRQTTGPRRTWAYSQVAEAYSLRDRNWRYLNGRLSRVRDDPLLPPAVDDDAEETASVARARFASIAEQLRGEQDQ